MRMAVLLCCALLTGAASPTFAGLDITAVACNTGRFSLSISRPTPVTLRATTNYFAFNLNFLSDNATQSGGKCAGCGIGACLVWNTASVINIRAGGAGTPYVVSGPGLKGNMLWWGDGTPNCSTDPVRNRTWGQLKSLYR